MCPQVQAETQMSCQVKPVQFQSKVSSRIRIAIVGAAVTQSLLCVLQLVDGNSPSIRSLWTEGTGRMQRPTWPSATSSCDRHQTGSIHRAGTLCTLFTLLPSSMRRSILKIIPSQSQLSIDDLLSALMIYYSSNASLENTLLDLTGQYLKAHATRSLDNGAHVHVPPMVQDWGVLL